MTVVVNARGVPLSYSAASLYHFSATDAAALLVGTDSNDSFWGDPGVTVTLAGGAGDDIYHVYSTNNRPSEAANQGIDTVETWMSYQLPDHIENLTVTGSGRQALGNDLDNIITGGSGRQTLDGGPGDDVLIGGAGSDIFAVTAGHGSDLIADFGAADSLRLSGYGFTSFDDITARLSQQGGDAVLDLGDGDILVFADTDAGDLRAEQFALEIDLSGMTQTFADEFDTLSLWDGAAGTWDSNFSWGAENGSTLASHLNWNIDTDYGPTQSLNPFSIDNGVLTITAQAAPQTMQAEIEGFDYTSGLLTSYASFTQTYGYFEIRADMPEEKGAWPAFWLLPADGNWPPELDVIEMIGQDPDRLILTAHSGVDGVHTVDTHYAQVDDTSGFHSYGVLWGPDEIVWTFDGVAVGRVETPADMQGPMYMVVNLGVGGIAGTPGTALAEGAEMKIDYIRAYALGDRPTEPSNAGDDTLVGTAAAETLDGGAGNDLLRGLTGDDLLFGGAGDDTLHGGQGSDTYDGGAGSDTVCYPGTNYSVTIDLAAGIAKPFGATETFVSIENAIGGNANDTLRGDDGDNALGGGAGNDLLIGAGGDDRLDGGSGADTFGFARLDLVGGDGNDTLAGFERGIDRLSFTDVVDADDDGSAGLDDLLAAVSSVTDAGPGGDVTVAFDNGASITFSAAGTGAIDSLDDLVNNATTQILVS